MGAVPGMLTEHFFVAKAAAKVWGFTVYGFRFDNFLVLVKPGMGKGSA